MASIRELSPDVVFLDVRISVLEEVGVESLPAVVLVTACDASTVGVPEGGSRVRVSRSRRRELEERLVR